MNMKNFDKPPLPANDDKKEPSLRFGKVKQPRMPDFEAAAERAYEEHPFSKSRRDILKRILDVEPFDHDMFLKTLNGWNENAEKEKGFEGEPLQIEAIECAHGRLKVYHFAQSRAVKFGFVLKQDSDVEG